MVTHLYRYWDNNGSLLYIGISINAFVRAAQHRDTAQWFSSISKMTVENFPTREAAIEAEAEAIRTEHPAHNKMHQAKPQKVSKRRPYIREENASIISENLEWAIIAEEEEGREERIEVERKRALERSIRQDFERLSDFSWDRKAPVIVKYMALLQSKTRSKTAKRALARAEKKLAEVAGYFERNPHRH